MHVKTKVLGPVGGAYAGHACNLKSEIETQISNGRTFLVVLAMATMPIMYHSLVRYGTNYYYTNSHLIELGHELIDQTVVHT